MDGASRVVGEGRFMDPCEKKREFFQTYFLSLRERDRPLLGRRPHTFDGGGFAS